MPTSYYKPRKLARAVMTLRDHNSYPKVLVGTVSTIPAKQFYRDRSTVVVIQKGYNRICKNKTSGVSEIKNQKIKIDCRFTTELPIQILYENTVKIKMGVLIRHTLMTDVAHFQLHTRTHKHTYSG